MSVGYITATFCSFAAWLLFYLSVFKLIPRASFRLTRKSSVEEFFCRIVTLIHAVLVVVLSISSVFINQTWPFREPAGPNLAVQDGICILSIGYFLFDLSWCLYHSTEGWFMLFHHLISITCFATALYRGIYGDEVTAILFATELTNPLLQFRWFLLNVSWNKTRDSIMASLTKKRKLSECDFEFVEKDDVDQDGEEHVGNDSSVLNRKTDDGNAPETVENNSKEALDDLKTPQALGSPTQPLPKEKRLDIIVVDILFFSLFTVMRVILGTIYFAIYQSSSSPDLLARLGATVVYMIGLVFWFRMVGYLSSNYFGNPTQKAEK